MTIASNLGYPSIGPRRELKTALEAFWAGQAAEAELMAMARALRAGGRTLQQGSGISHIPSADFALYDHVLETACAFGAIPNGYGWHGEGPASLATLFALARGARGTEAERAAGIAPDAAALEMTKWFDTNYHYLVPRLSARTRFRLVDDRWAGAVREGLQHGTRTRPVLLGPMTLLLLSKADDGTRPLDLLPSLLPAYAEALRSMAEASAAWVQLDEPCPRHRSAGRRRGGLPDSHLRVGGRGARPRPPAGALLRRVARQPRPRRRAARRGAAPRPGARA
jgi:5-methyltetrahydropteroyltriglutamate--homocysteine methyltransferase